PAASLGRFWWDANTSRKWMRSFAKLPRLVLTAAAVWLLVPGAAAAQTAQERYESALKREEKVRAVMDAAPAATPEITAQVTQAMTAHELLVRRFPTSGYADNALFQAATLGDDAFAKCRRVEHRERAMRYYKWLV